MKERPILFSAPMVRALLDGRKTQTRRTIKMNPEHSKPEHVRDEWWHIHETGDIKCPYGKAGDRLWVRETHYLVHQQGNPNLGVIEIDYKADPDYTQRMCPQKWRPAIHMPRWASRINSDITDIRAERLNDINEADAIAEGIQQYKGALRWMRYLDAVTGEANFNSAKEAFHSLWESINGAGSWDANPWVWVVEFKKLTTNSDL